MQYSFTLDDDTATCIVTVTGVNKRPEDTIKLQQLAKSVNQEHNISRFLFDMRAAEIDSSPADDYEAANVPADRSYSLHGMRFASVFSGDLHRQKFMETVAINRGYQVRVFNEMTDALNWLSEQET